MKHFLPQRFSRLKPSVLLAGFLLFLLPQFSQGQGSETFTNCNATASYANNSFVGDNSVTWSYVSSRNEDTYGITGKGLMLRNLSTGSKVTSSSISGGIGNFTVKLKKAFTGAGTRQVTLYVNGVLKGTSVGFDNTTTQTFSVADINVEGNIVLELRNNTSSQITIDDISWTGYVAPTNPTIALNTTGISDFGTLTVGTTSTTKSFTVTGSNLTNDIIVKCPTSEFKISSSGSAGTFSNSDITLTQSGGSVASTTIYVNYTPSAASAQTGTITVSSTGATDKTVSLSGTGTNATFAPTVTTTAYSALQTTSATSGGNITADGGSTVTTRGVVWDIASGPTVALTTKTIENGTFSIGAYASNITGLTPNTKYYVRAYATNTNGTSYGDEISFTTPKEAPLTQASQITTTAIASNSMSLSWINGDGSKRIVIMNTSNSFTAPVDGTDPAANNVYSGGEQVVYNGSNSAVTVTGLNPTTSYWFRVYEANNFTSTIRFNQNTATNNPLSFTTAQAPCLAESFDNGTTAPSGWTMTGLGTYTGSTDYATAPYSLAFNTSNDILVTPELSGPATSLSFWLKSQSASGSSLLVEGSIDEGVTWNTVETITSFPSPGTLTTITNNLGSASKFRFTYTKGTGNIAFDDLQIVCGTFTPTITGTSISGTAPYCANTQVNVTFSTKGTFNVDGNGNKFAVELSDASGSFSSPTIIGQGNASPITATFPAGAATGSGYKVRVSGLDPVTSGPETTAFGINALPVSNIPTVSPTADQTINTNTTGSTLTATVANTSTFIWKFGTVSGNYTNTISGATSATYLPTGSDFGAAGTYYVAAVATSSCGSVVGTSDPVKIIVNSAQPAIVVSTNGPLNFNAPVNGQSSQQSYTVSGSALSADIQITPPTNFLISEISGSGYSSSAINLTPTSGVVTTKTIYVVYAPSAQSASHGGDITNASAGATTLNVALTGNSIPAISHTGGSFTDVTGQVVTSSSTGQAFVAVGSNLTGNLVITAPSHFEVSKTSASAGFSSTVSFTPSSGSVSGNFWIRYSPTTVSSHSGNVTLAVAADNISENIAVSGTSIDFPIPAAGVLLLEDDFEGTASTLLSANGWTAHSSVGSVPATIGSSNLTYSNYASSGIGNAAELSATGKEDVNKAFTQVASGETVYASFLVNVASVSKEDYFFTLTTATNPSAYPVRVFIKSGTTGKMKLGATLAAAATASDYISGEYDLGTTYLVAVKYTFINGGAQSLKLYINPSTVFEPVNADFTITSTTGGQANIGRVALRQDNIGAITLDGIRVGTGWGSVLGNPTFSDAASTLATGNYRDITVDATNSSTVTLSGATKIYGTLTLKKGKLLTDATNLLTLKDGSTVVLPTAGNVSFVDGPMAYEVATTNPTSLNLPVGKGNNYRPIILDVTQTSATTTTYTAEQHDSAPATRTLPGDNSLDHVSGVRYFSINQSPVNALSEGVVQLSYGADDKVNTTADLRIAKSNGGAWVDLGNGGVTNGVITSGVNFTSFSDFVLANKTGGNNPLPVELLTFTASSENKAVKLNWSTATEKNADRFEVERSANGIEFVKITSVKAGGNSTNEINYNAIDANPLAGISYYRLKQIDLDGTAQYSKILTVKQGAVGREISLYPNPATEVINILLPISEQAEIQVVNLLGQIVLKQTVRNTTEAKLNMETLPAGTYQLIVNAQDFQSITKFVKLNK